MAPLPALLWLRTRAGGRRPERGDQRFYDALLAVMKEAKRLTFDQRYQRLAPAITATFDLGLMTRLVGRARTGRSFAADQQQRFTDAFTRYTISIYANRFDDFDGERFEVDPRPSRQSKRHRRADEAGQIGRR